MTSRYFPVLLLVLALISLASVRAQSTVNVGFTSLNTNTGYILNANGSLSTNGEVLVGYFSIPQSQISAIINGWTDSLASYSKYNQLFQYFTQVGTGAGNYGTIPSGTAWDFNANGQVTGTSSGISTNVLPQGSQLYIWSFSTTNLTSNGITSSTQWSLATATNWVTPSSGTASLQLANVASASNVLIGTSLLGSGGSNNNSIEMFTQRSLTWTNGAGDFLWNTSSTNWTYSGAPVTYRNGDIVTFDTNASGVITLTNAPASGFNPGGINISLVNSLTLTGSGIGGSGALTLSGVGQLSIAKSNSFTGGVVFNGGNLSFGNSSAMGSGALVVNSNATLQPSANGFILTNNITVAANASLTLLTQSNLFLTLSTSISGAGGLTKSGPGTLLLKKAESYTGPTLLNAGVLSLGTSGSLASTNINITGGTLFLGASNQLTQTPSVTLNGGTISTSGGSVRGSSIQLGTLTLTGIGVIDFSSLIGNSTISVASISGLSPVNILNVYNYVPGTTSLTDLAGSTDLNDSLLSDIKFYSGGSGSTQLGIGGFSGNAIVPVPEPPVAIAIMMTLFALVVLRFGTLPRLAARIPTLR